LLDFLNISEESESWINKETRTQLPLKSDRQR
jgi:hypothetical protein